MPSSSPCAVKRHCLCLHGLPQMLHTWLTLVRPMLQVFYPAQLLGLRWADQRQEARDDFNSQVLVPPPALLEDEMFVAVRSYGHARMLWELTMLYSAPQREPAHQATNRLPSRRRRA